MKVFKSFLFLSLFLLAVLSFSEKTSAYVPCLGEETVKIGEVDASNCNKPNYVCCTGGGEDSNCPGPWSAVDYVCEEWLKTDGTRCQIIKTLTISTCYTTDICEGNNPGGTAKIVPGICRGAGLSVSCEIGGWYKTCCNNDQGSFGVCGITGPYSGSCNSGFVVRYDDPNINYQTCRSTSELQPTCSLSANPSSGTAPLSGTLSWSSQNSNSCTASSNPTDSSWNGSKATSGSQGYGPINQSTTYSLSCSGPGGSGNCSVGVSTGPPPPPPPQVCTWCTNQQQCLQSGCSWQGQSSYCAAEGDGCCECGPPPPPPPPAQHTECSNQSCVTVSGGGANQCATDLDCCDPSPSPSCDFTSVNGGSKYTNSRQVALSLSASAGGNSSCNQVKEMRFRNENLAWSSYETYSTTKSWILSSGSDGTRSVTAQYKDQSGDVSATGDPACRDEIIYDTTPPISEMSPIPQWYAGSPIGLSWTASDNLASSDELRFHLQFKVGAQGDWVDLGSTSSSPMSSTSYDYAGEEGVLYCFRVRALDGAGNYEPFPPGTRGDGCTTIDFGIEMYGFGWEVGIKNPDVWVNVFDGVSGIDYSRLKCEWKDVRNSWFTRGCSFDTTDPATVTMMDVPYQTESATANKARFTACDNAGTCVTNEYTVNNKTTGPWVQTFGADVHSNSNLQLRPAP